MLGFVSASGPVRSWTSVRDPLQLVSRFVFGLVSGFASDSRPDSCLVRVRVRVWFVSGSCLVRVWFVSLVRVSGSITFVSGSCFVRIGFDPGRVWFVSGSWFRVWFGSRLIFDS